MTSPLPYPAHLEAPGAGAASFQPACRLTDLGPGTMLRASFGDVDVLVASTDEGVVATPDRCPHQAAPLSLGSLAGCVVTCPLHDAAFNLATGEVTVMPTTGGLTPDGEAHPGWTPAGSEPKADRPGRRTDARRLTRVQRPRFFPVRIVDGWVQVAVPGVHHRAMLDGALAAEPDVPDSSR